MTANNEKNGIIILRDKNFHIKNTENSPQNNIKNAKTKEKLCFKPYQKL